MCGTDCFVSLESQFRAAVECVICLCFLSSWRSPRVACSLFDPPFSPLQPFSIHSYYRQAVIIATLDPLWFLWNDNSISSVILRIACFDVPEWQEHIKYVGYLCNMMVSYREIYSPLLNLYVGHPTLIGGFPTRKTRNTVCWCSSVIRLKRLENKLLINESRHSRDATSCNYPRWLMNKDKAAYSVVSL